MSRERYEDDCPDCRPAMLDMETGKPLPNDHPVMITMNKIWDETSRDEREAFHRFTCQNSRARNDLFIVEELTKRLQKALSN